MRAAQLHLQLLERSETAVRRITASSDKAQQEFEVLVPMMAVPVAAAAVWRVRESPGTAQQASEGLVPMMAAPAAASPPLR